MTGICFKHASFSLLSKLYRVQIFLISTQFHAFCILKFQGVTAGKRSEADVDPKLMGTGKGLKAILGGLEELWDQSQYTEEYNLSQFLAKLNG